MYFSSFISHINKTWQLSSIYISHLLHAMFYSISLMFIKNINISPSRFIHMYILGHKYGILTFSKSKIKLWRPVGNNCEPEYQIALCKSHYSTLSYKSLRFYVFVRWLVLWFLKPTFSEKMSILYIFCK